MSQPQYGGASGGGPSEPPTPKEWTTIIWNLWF